MRNLAVAICTLCMLFHGFIDFAAAQTPPRYKLKDLGVLHGGIGSMGLDVSNSGEVLARSNPTAEDDGPLFSWKDGVRTQVSGPGRVTPFGFNYWGAFAAFDWATTPYPFVKFGDRQKSFGKGWKPAWFNPQFGVMPGAHLSLEIYKLTDSGLVLGEAWVGIPDPNNPEESIYTRHGFIYDSTGGDYSNADCVTVAQSLCVSRDFVIPAMNKSGNYVLAGADPAVGWRNMFLVKNGQRQQLSLPSDILYIHSYLINMNDANVVVSNSSSNDFGDCLLWNGGGNAIRLDAPGVQCEEPMIDNAYRVVVRRESNGVPNPGVWVAGQIYSLSSLAGNPTGWTLDYPSHVNARGDIVGTGRLNGARRGFILLVNP